MSQWDQNVYHGWRIVLERDGERLRARVVSTETGQRVNVIGRFETEAAARRAAQLKIAEMLTIAPPIHVPAAPLPNTIDNPYDEYFVWHIGDWHVGKKETDHHTFPARVARIGDRLIELRERTLAAYRHSGLLIADTGDMLDGQDIYETQVYNQSIPDGRDQVALAAEHITRLVERLLPYYGPIRYAKVAGNHGRIRGMPDSANLDVLLADALAQSLAGKVEVIYKPKDPWQLRVHVHGDYYALLYHGHKTCKTEGSIISQVGKWNMVRAFSPFHYLLLGHLHHLYSRELNSVFINRTGTMLTDDPYAREFGWDSSTFSRLWGVNATHDRRTVTTMIGVDQL